MGNQGNLQGYNANRLLFECTHRQAILPSNQKVPHHHMVQNP